MNTEAEARCRFINTGGAGGRGWPACAIRRRRPAQRPADWCGAGAEPTAAPELLWVRQAAAGASQEQSCAA